MWDVAIISHISPESLAREWTLVLCRIAGRGDASALRNAGTEPRTHFDAHAISSFSPGMQAAFMTWVSPRPRLCRCLGGEEFGLRISTPGNSEQEGGSRKLAQYE